MATVKGILKPRVDRNTKSLLIRIAALEAKPQSADVGRDLRALYNDLVDAIERKNALCLENEKMATHLKRTYVAGASNTMLTTGRAPLYFVDKKKITDEDRMELQRLSDEARKTDAQIIAILQKHMTKKEEVKTKKPKKVKPEQTGFDSMLHPVGMRFGCQQTIRGKERGQEFVQ